MYNWFYSVFLTQVQFNRQRLRNYINLLILLNKDRALFSGYVGTNFLNGLHVCVSKEHGKPQFCDKTFGVIIIIIYIIHAIRTKLFWRLCIGNCLVTSGGSMRERDVNSMDFLRTLSHFSSCPKREENSYSLPSRIVHNCYALKLAPCQYLHAIIIKQSRHTSRTCKSK